MRVLPLLGAERITLSGETAYVWTIDQEKNERGFDDRGFSIRHGRFQFDLTNVHDAKGLRYMIDLSDRYPPESGFDHYLIRLSAGAMSREEFLEVAERTLTLVRRKDQRWPPGGLGAQ